MFNTTDVVSFSLQSGDSTATVAANNSTSFTMNGVSATITVPCGSDIVNQVSQRPVKIKAKNALGTETPDWFESTATVPVYKGPRVTNVEFGDYPALGNEFDTSTIQRQTELKTGDQITADFEFDTENVNTIYYTSVATGTETGVTTSGISALNIPLTVGSHGVSNNNNPGGALRDIQLQVKGTGKTGPSHTSTEQLRVNNQKPTFSNPSVSYPSGQSAIKTGEDASVDITVSNQGQYPKYTYTDNGSSDVTITDADVYTVSKTATYASGNYVPNTSNYKLLVTRAENGESAEKTAKIFIANVQPEIDVTLHPSGGGSQLSRLQSGGNDNTSVPTYEVRVTSNQKLLNFGMDIDSTAVNGAGSWANGSSWTSSDDLVWKRNIKIDDDHDKGTFNWTSLNIENYSGMTRSAFTGNDTGETYELGGFISRDITLTKTQNETEMNVLYADYSKVELSWSASSDVNIQSPYGTQAGLGIPNNWCLDDQSPGEAPGGPVTIRILDLSKTNAATLADTTITIEETV